jgi:glycerophosphoryl diester phosphodiesterase
MCVFTMLFLDIYLNAVTNVDEIYPHRHRSNGLHYVIDFDLEELRRLSVHERTRPLNGTQVYPLRFPSRNKARFHLATLNETIDLLLGLNYATGQHRQLLIEIKKPEYHFQWNKAISDVVVATLNAYNLNKSTDPIIIQTFHIEELIRIRRVLASQVRLFALMTWNRVNESSSDYDYYRSQQGLEYLSRFVQAIAPDHQFLVDYHANGTILGCTNVTKWAHQYGLAVYPFTFRQDTYSGSSFQQWIDYFWRTVQVDGFITDHPDVVLDWLRHDRTSAYNNSATLRLSSVMMLMFMISLMTLLIMVNIVV